MSGPWAAYALVNDISTMGGVDREEFWSAEGYAPPHRSAIRGRQRPGSDVHSEQELHADCLSIGTATPLTISQNASVISNRATGIQTSWTIELVTNPAS